jgi:hypothetical protein
MDKALMYIKYEQERNLGGIFQIIGMPIFYEMHTLDASMGFERSL